MTGTGFAFRGPGSGRSACRQSGLLPPQLEPAGVASGLDLPTLAPAPVDPHGAAVCPSFRGRRSAAAVGWSCCRRGLCRAVRAAPASWRWWPVPAALIGARGEAQVAAGSCTRGFYLRSASTLQPSVFTSTSAAAAGSHRPPHPRRWATCGTGPTRNKDDCNSYFFTVEPSDGWCFGRKLSPVLAGRTTVTNDSGVTYLLGGVVEEPILRSLKLPDSGRKPRLRNL
jgi:hypothetical protein